MALTKITATNIGANAVTANSIGYTPANKAGDTFTGQVRIVKAGNNTTALTPTTAKDFSTKISADGVTNTQGYIFDGIAMGGAGEEYSGIYSYDDGSSAGTGVVVFGGNASAISKGIDVDSGGRVRMPNQPNFGMAMSATSVTRGAVLPFNTTLHNVGSHYNTSTYRFTAPVSGVYYFSGHFRLETGEPTMTYHRFILQKNGNQLDASMGHLTDRLSGNYSSVSVTFLVNLAAGDYVSPYFASNLSGTSGTTPQECFFGGYLIG